VSWPTPTDLNRLSAVRVSPMRQGSDARTAAARMPNGKKMAKNALGLRMPECSAHSANPAMPTTIPCKNAETAIRMTWPRELQVGFMAIVERDLSAGLSIRFFVGPAALRCGAF